MNQFSSRSAAIGEAAEPFTQGPYGTLPSRVARPIRKRHQPTVVVDAFLESRARRQVDTRTRILGDGLATQQPRPDQAQATLAAAQRQHLRDQSTSLTLVFAAVTRLRPAGINQPR